MMEKNQQVKFRDSQRQGQGQQQQQQQQESQQKNPSSKRRSWDESYESLVKYQREHGNCNVPYRQKPLGLWVAKQKRIKEMLSQQQLHKLDAIGFNWNKLDQDREDKWNAQFQKLQGYQREHGDCNVIKRYEPDPTLGQWVHSQRRLYNKGQLRDDRKQLLCNLGMTWHLKNPVDCSTRHSDNAFQDMYDRLVKFHEENGHCLVPAEYANDRPLASFVANQRRKYRIGELETNRVKMLEEIGFVWKVDHYNADASLHQRHWNEMFNELKRYRDEYQHTQVPDNTPPGYHKKLGMWVNMQRTYRRNQDRYLTPERQQTLDSIGFWWGHEAGVRSHHNEPALEKQWDEKFKALKAYKRRHGHLLIRKDRNSPLGQWIGTQRNLNNKNQIQPHRKKKLEAIGFLWSAKEERIDPQWVNMYERLYQFYNENGHSNVLPTYAADPKLAQWVTEQRTKEDRDQDCTSEYRRELLNSVNFRRFIEERAQKDEDAVTSATVSSSKQPSKKRKRQEDESSRARKYLAVYSSDDDLYYRAKVLRKRDDNGHLRIKYDDGDKQWIDPSTTEFQELEDRDEQLPARKVSPPLDTLTVGSHISVWWPGEKQYYGAIIKKIKPERPEPYRLYYDDGDKEWTCLSHRRFALGSVGVPVKSDPCFQELEDRDKHLPTTQVSQSLDTLKVGSRISVWWPGEHQYYEAVLKKIKTERSEPYRLHYDDGDKEWTCLSNQRFTLGSIGVQNDDDETT